MMLLGDSTGIRYPRLVIFKAASFKELATQATNTKTRCGFGKKVSSEIKPLRDELDMSLHTNSKGKQCFTLLSYFLFKVF